MFFTKRILWLSGLLVAVLSVMPSVAEAQQTKIGYTDPNMIVLQMPDYQDIQSELRSLYQGSQQEIQQQWQEYQTKLQDYARKRQLMSEETRQQTEQELQQLQQEIQQMIAQKQRELTQKEAELIQPLLQKVQNAIDEVAQEKNLDLVLSTQAANASVILYASESTVDITEPVMAKLGLEMDQSTGSVSSSN